jgi:hypothetical protein
MSNPLQNAPPPERRSATEKILAIVDIIAKIANAILHLFGRRSTDGQ